MARYRWGGGETYPYNGGMKFKFKGKLFYIENEYWEMWSMMHTVRAGEALAYELSIVYQDKDISEDDIYKIIEEEYELQSRMPEIVENAIKAWKEYKAIESLKHKGKLE